MKNKSKSAANWLVANPDRPVSEAATKFKVSTSAIYNAKKRTAQALSSPMTINIEAEQKSQSLVVIIKTDDPAALLRSLFS